MLDKIRLFIVVSKRSLAYDSLVLSMDRDARRISCSKRRGLAASLDKIGLFAIMNERSLTK
jgi:hypothetical protein